MLKAVIGKPGDKQLLVIGLSFGNLDKFAAEPMDTHIPIRAIDTTLPIDVILFSGETVQAKAKNKTSDQEMLLLGLSLYEVKLLREQPGKTILQTTGAPLGVPFDIIIFSGETEAAMTDQMSEMIGPDTKLNIDPRAAPRLRN